MKKVVLSLALVAMMFVSCKEAATETPAEEVVTEEVAPVVEETVEVVDSAATEAVEAPAAEAPAAH
ncbi:MAG: hypothetical protein ABNG98_02830 [Flavobacterium sp.]|jgi:PBP1b-binding outer membrane lipoprotein LpoB